MKENQRQCIKCGRSPSLDPNVKLYRFPRPGTRNLIRSESWAKFCFPDKECSLEFQRKLFTEHRMLCDHHFKVSSFMDFSRKILDRSAIPETVKRVVVLVPPIASQLLQSAGALADITNTEKRKFQEHDQMKCRKSQILPTAEAIVDDRNIMKKKVASSMPMQLEAGPSQVKSKKTVEIVAGVEKKTAIDSNKHKLLIKKCRRSLQKICHLKNRIKKLKNGVVLKAVESNEAVNILVKKISPTLALFLQGEIKNCKRKQKGRRWTKEQKITALRLYKRSPTCYRLLRRLLTLPSPSSLKKLLGQFPLRVGINNKIFTILKKHAQKQDPLENEYILTFDEMSIRKNLQYNKKLDLIEGYQDHADHGRSPQVASHALVFMLCGVRKLVKQPVAFYLSGSSVTADRLAVIIKQVLRRCFDSDINISATVCDMDGVNRRALGILGATVKKPIIEIDDHKVVSLFDPPHLLKCFRNLFLKYDVKHTSNICDGTGKGVAKWSHIQQFFELDKNPNFVFAPALTSEHLAPNAKQKMRVKLAAQVLSHSVAAGMFGKISQGELTTDATVTANLVSNMDKLFDCLNSQTPDLRRGKPHSTNLTDKTPHLQTFRDMKRFFETVKFIGCRSKPPSVDGWIWTLNAMEMFWRSYKLRHPAVRSLSTRRLQQDPLENLFGCIRGLCGSNSNPTANQFIAGLKTALLSSLATAGVRGANCETDNNAAILNNFKEWLMPEHNAPETVHPEPSCAPEQNINDYIPNDLNENELSGELQACAYVCGFLLKSYKNDCGLCKNNLNTENSDLIHNFINMKEYSTIKQSLKYASIDLIKAVENTATVINNYLEKNSYTENIKQKLKEILKATDFSFLECIEHKLVIIKFITENTIQICIKRFCILKNRNFVEEASKSALRKKINILKHT